jgi:hypothetical protein
MPFWLKKIAIVLILFSFGTRGFAQITTDKDDAIRFGGPIITAVPFLLISPDARGAAMGDVGVASSPDINSQHWNAAKYPFMSDINGISLTYTPWLRMLVPDMDMLYLAGYYRLGNDWVVASSLRFFSMGKVIFRRDQQDPGTTIHPNEYAFDASLSRKLSDNFSLAVTGRYIRSDLTKGYFDPTSGSRASAVNSGAVDISMFYTKDFSMPNTEGGSFALGLNLSNIGAKVSYSDAADREFLPANMRLGASYTVQLDRYNEITAMIDLNKLLVPTPPRTIIEDGDTTVAGMDNNVGVIQGVFQSFYDAPGGFREELREVNISVGFEYWYNQTMALRAGYFHENKIKGNRQFFTIGAGLRFNVFEIDFSYLLPRGNSITGATNPMRNTLRFTLRFNFAEYMRRQNQQ